MNAVLRDVLEWCRDNRPSSVYALLIAPVVWQMGWHGTIVANLPYIDEYIATINEEDSEDCGDTTWNG